MSAINAVLVLNVCPTTTQHLGKFPFSGMGYYAIHTNGHGLQTTADVLYVDIITQYDESLHKRFFVERRAIVEDNA